MVKVKANHLLYVVFVCLVFDGFWVLWCWPDDNFHLVFCDVGQGDAILMSFGETQVLVDGGSDDRVLSCLGEHMPFWDRELEMVILTHPEKDHGGGLISVIERYKVSYFVWGVLGNPAVFYQKLLVALSKEDVCLINPWQGDELTMGRVKIKFYWPDRDWVAQRLSVKSEDLDNFDVSKSGLMYQSTSGSPNDFSLVFKVSFNNFDVLLTGDADQKIQPEILMTTSFPQVDVLKVAHHGSRYAFLDEVLSQVRPELGVISVGKNPWGHPTQMLLDQLSRFGMVIRRTDKDGTVEVISDGEKWGIK
ncbi:hypothetical protein COT63_01915 [Candidatus Shapirobacteria bacterium CG09_land_8_20_14_0_10_38_17]|uniref:Metallo-beta-lactamase domain-containing protein n=1 Tax=Candidatus Shapirobacteria bacterium CG09_land_8_20_14_0_10_38_17 TaxID=1974884 RepID=A0A2H0WQX4_9BACT|nr:MAG: hypothetical protein COT63_01915 [Candidatus Shapirobacteria bacterium CG09_land_8_20_14_0_10_38_17]